MDWTYKEEKAAGGRWILIKGCPLKEKHTLNDEEQNISGPAFADCASCENQIGTDYEILTPDADYNGATVFPANLNCSILSPQESTQASP